METKFCFILEPGTSYPKADPGQSGARAFIGRRGGFVQKQHRQLWRHLAVGPGGLSSSLLTVLITVCLQFQGQSVPISLRPVLGMVAVRSGPQSGHHAVNVFHRVGFLCRQDSSQDTAQNMIYSPWGGTKHPWLCLMTLLLLFGLVWLLSFVSAFSHFSDSLKFSYRQKACGGYGRERP